MAEHPQMTWNLGKRLHVHVSAVWTSLRTYSLHSFRLEMVPAKPYAYAWVQLYYFIFLMHVFKYLYIFIEVWCSVWACVWKPCPWLKSRFRIAILYTGSSTIDWLLTGTPWTIMVKGLKLDHATHLSWNKFIRRIKQKQYPVLQQCEAWNISWKISQGFQCFFYKQQIGVMKYRKKTTDSCDEIQRENNR